MPTQFMVVRDKSVCISDDSHFYNKSAAQSSDYKKSEKDDHMALQFFSQDEIYDQVPKEHIPGFSFFGK